MTTLGNKHDAKAQEATDATHKELMSSVLLTEHGLTIEREGTYLVVRKGNLELVDVAFDWGGHRFCRITNFVQNFPDKALQQYDARTIAEGVAEFRRQLSLALDIYIYRHNQQMFANLGLG